MARAGALLRSGSLTDFQALGAVGTPVYSTAEQLLAAMRRQLGQDVAELFAIPKPNESGVNDVRIIGKLSLVFLRRGFLAAAPSELDFLGQEIA